MLGPLPGFRLRCNVPSPKRIRLITNFCFSKLRIFCVT